MKLSVFSTNRALKDFYDAQKDSPFLPPAKTIADFFSDIVIVQGAKIPPSLRVLFLWRAIRNIKIENLGFERTFLRFLEGSNFIFKFFDELDSAQVKISDIDKSDTYGDYSDHLSLLERVFEAYNNGLKARGFCDYYAIPSESSNDSRLNIAYLKAFSVIEIHLDGIFSVKEMAILRKCAEFSEIIIFFSATKYNKNLLEKMLQIPIERGFKYSFHIAQGKLKKIEKLAQNTQNINFYAFDLRISEALLVLAKVNEWLQDSPQNEMAVILPSDDFARYLQLFDSPRNLNYAMGFSDDKKREKLRELREKHDNPSALLDEILARFKLENELHILAMRDILEGLSCEEIIEFLLQNIANLNDNNGGKVGVYGILESRGKAFKRAVIVDFNADFIPCLNENDMFLNTALRKRLNLPTLRDKEDLQRHYYFMLINNTECVEIAYCKNALISSVAEVLRTLSSAKIAEFDGDKKWRFFPNECKKEYISDEIIAQNTLFRLSATAIKAFLACKRKFYFSYLCNNLHDSEEKEEILGAKIHNILREMGQNFDKSKITIAKNDLDTEIALAQLEPFFKAQRDLLQNGTEILAVEQKKEFQIDDFKFVCIMDRIDRVKTADGADKIRIIDYKFKNKFEIKKEGFLQLAIYKRALCGEFSEIECLYIDLQKNKEYIMDKSAEIEANEMLDTALCELKGEINFAQCEDKNECKWCEYGYLCGRY